MKNKLKNGLLTCLAIMAANVAVNAQEMDKATMTKNIDDYLELMEMGYSETEIFQDLGNVNFIVENYENAAFWYEKLLASNVALSDKEKYQERLAFAQSKTNGKSVTKKANKDWLAAVEGDYKVASTKIANNLEEVALSPDGRFAFFSKESEQKPEYGVFSKKEIVYELYRAENKNGKWSNFRKLAVTPKHFSAKHPTVSKDGSQLFFASNMPGSYGKYDIYVANIKADGSLGQAMNLGPKVNSKKDDMNPTYGADNTLYFASNGRKGYGGMDLFAVQVNGNKLGSSRNLGNTVNSSKDDIAIKFDANTGMAHVTTNRNSSKSLSQIAVSFPQKKSPVVLKDEKGLLRALNDDSSKELSTTVFDE
ncbi:MULTISPECIES: PD40 domain-containing protein [Flavobacteriaceae]|uniref:TolB family protein n=1 Tax=Flavobacteriaceae TaxID=49546 RepID=UPI0010AE4FF0|nr:MULTISPECIES: PD40 domain-containing protein [Flavobacteriaceae]NJB35812.1 cell envelope biogenesis protein OmpA [Croceivirga sp. JEA036]TKD65897.1 cell envelope biogenesis protein OmpA [Flavobacterium sp. ASW18X]